MKYKHIINLFFIVSLFWFFSCDYQVESLDDENTEDSANVSSTEKSREQNSSTTSSTSSSSTTSTSVTFGGDTDILLIMYLDGDNNLYNYILKDINEAEAGLAELTSSSKTINVVALLDGPQSTGPSSSSKSKSRILQLGADYSTGQLALYQLSDSTVEITDYAGDWISSGEVDMGSSETLANFLNFVNKYYTADTVILQISDHGGGPGDGYSDSTTTSSSRIICVDETSGSYLSTTDVSDALSSAGYNENNKLDWLLFDLCTESCIEEAYQYKDYACYMTASPSYVPSYGYDYETLIVSLGSSTSIKQVAQDQIDDYKAYYDDTMWEDGWESLSDEDKEELNYDNSYQMPCLTLLDLSKLTDVKNSLDIFVETVMSNDEYIIEDIFTQTKVKYEGTYVVMYDIGCIMDNFISYAEEKEYETLKQVALDVKNTLSSAIIKSYRDDIFTDSTGDDFYVNTLNATDTYYGLTITGYGIYKTVPDFYSRIAFGEDCQWIDFISSL